jgi:hypothetical protein
MNPAQKQLVLDVAAKMIKMLYELDDETNLRQVIFDLESLLADEYGLSHDDILDYMQAHDLAAVVAVSCFVCGAETPEINAVKVEPAAGIRSYLCASCNQIRLYKKSDTRTYADLSDEEKRLLKVVQGK